MRRSLDLTQEQAAEKAGIVANTWRRYEWGQRNLPLDKLEDLANSLGFTVEDVLRLRTEVMQTDTIAPMRVGFEVGRPLVGIAELPLRGKVQAGAWLETDDLDQSEPQSFPVAADRRYPHAPQWLSMVVGDSVDQLGIFDGDLAQFVDAIAIDYKPRHGDVVEAERLRFDGALRELTIKQVEIDQDGAVRLWPRSNNPKWKDPLVLDHGAEGEDGIEVRVRGVLLRSIRSY